MNIELFIFNNEQCFSSKLSTLMKTKILDLYNCPDSDIEQTFKTFLKKMNAISSQNALIIRRIKINFETENSMALENILFLLKYYDYSVSSGDGPLIPQESLDIQIEKDSVLEIFKIFILYPTLLPAFEILVFFFFKNCMNILYNRRKTLKN